MPYTPNASTPTPESLLPRSDSKNPATTCAGITSSGRPCRRSLASPASSPRGARRSSAPPNPTDAANAYCWQHRDQVPASSPSLPSPARLAQAHIAKPQRRTSTDTLVGKFDGVDLASTVVGAGPSRPPRQRPQQRPQQPARPSFWQSLCCMTGDGDQDDYVEVVKHKRRHDQYASQPAPRPPMMQVSRPGLVAPATRPTAHHMPVSAPAAPSLSPTQNFMRYIPPTLDPQATATLLSELSKPISTVDQDGYIYIFWLTPEASRGLKPSDDDAESLLQPPDPRPRGDRRASTRKEELLRANSIARPCLSSNRGLNGSQAVEERRTILLKIGRANNVHRRMAEWTRQCGYDLSLIRFYPYVPSSQLQTSSLTSPHGRPSLSPRPSDGVRKVPFVHRVERLIHLEFAGQRKKQGECDACGREHREWFEVEASRDGVRAVDAVVKKWVSWAEEEAKRNGR